MLYLNKLSLCSPASSSSLPTQTLPVQYFQYLITARLRLEGTSGGHLLQPHWLKQGHLELVTQDHIHTASEYLQGRRLHRLSGQPAVPVLSHPHSNVSLYSDGVSCVSVYAYCLWPCHWAPLKRAWLPLLYTLPSDIYLHW